jgi:hypothetical protein
MDPSVFFGAILGAMIAAMPPGHAGVVCDRRGFCVAQPQFQQPPVYIQPVPRFYQDPRVAPDYRGELVPQQHTDALGAKVKSGIYEFCGRHPEEPFCGDLDRYLQQHPDAR